MCPTFKWLQKMKNVDFTIHSNKAAQWLYEYRIKKFYISFLFQEAET
jgi:hypothetical protein